VFCASHREAYEKLTLLAESLFESHGLTLQPQKTHIVSRAAFHEQYLKSHKSKELEGLSEQFDEIASEIGVSRYEPIDPSSLTESQMSAIEALNLHGLVHEQLNADEIDIGLMNFLIRRLVQIDDASLAGDLVRHAEPLYPVFPRVIAYLGAVGPDQISDSAATAGELLALLSGSSVGHLPFHRALVLWLFGADTKWASALADRDRANLATSFEQATSGLEQRESILAMGRLNQQPWFRTRKRTWANFDAWQRRAFLAAASCLPKDEREHWYASVAKQVDPLEKAVIAWAKEHPFGT
jgi:hypothetical protein